MSSPLSRVGPLPARSKIISQGMGSFAKSPAPELPDEIKDLISIVAADAEVCQKIVATVNFTLASAHKRRRLHWFIDIGFVIADLLLLAIPYYTLQAFGVSADIANLIGSCSCLCVALGWQYLRFRNLELWLAGHGEAYLAGRIFRALELGIRYYSDYEKLSPLQHRRSRGILATRIQGVAVAYFVVYRKTKSTRFFRSQMRLQAKRSRNDVMTLVPGLVTASRQDISATMADLARLLIRTQTGYWHQTSDVARQGTRIPRRYTVSIWLASIIRETSVQVGMIAALATIVGAAVAVIGH
jgi:hypothetical protein